MKENDLTACGICSHQEFSIRYRKKDFSLAQCHSCGVLYRTPQPTSEEVRQLYTTAYYNPWHLEKEEAVKKIKMESFDRRLQEIQNYVHGGKILDVGCATGFFLEKAKSKGFDPYGLELSEFAFKQAHKTFGDHVFWGTIEDLFFENNFFDVITMFDLLEHVTNPVTTLRCCRRILKPKGIIAAVLPDTSSMSAKVMGKGWTHYKKEHLFYFSKQAIASLMEKESFEVIQIKPAAKIMNVEYLYHQFMQYPHHIATPLVSMLYKLLPNYLSRVSFSITMGEILVIARKGN